MKTTINKKRFSKGDQIKNLQIIGYYVKIFASTESLFTDF